jgi:pyrroline-5-carboxylate reductase
MFTGKKLAFIGTGVMGAAMIRGLLNQGMVHPHQIVGSNPLVDRNHYMEAKHGIHTTTDNVAAVQGADVIILSVKPQVLLDVLPEFRGQIKSDALILSIVAGMPIEAIVRGARHEAVARSMPNTPAQIGQGITVWTATSAVTATQRQEAQAIFGSLGQEVYVDDESYLDMATALSGSGPAYVFLLMEAMIDAGVHMGFSRRVAQDLVFRTIAGSVAFAEQSGKHVAELRNQVTSPGGTTAEALYHMEKRGFRTLISRGIWAAYQRSVSLGQGLKTEAPHE